MNYLACTFAICTGAQLTASSMYNVISACVNWGELICKFNLSIETHQTCLSELLEGWAKKQGSKKPWDIWRKLSSAIEKINKYGPKNGRKLRELSGVGELRVICT